MMTQGVLPFQYEEAPAGGDVTALAGLPLYLELAHVAGLPAAIERQVRAAGDQGWSDTQMILAGVLLNLAGGDCVDDLEALEGDAGFGAVLRRAEAGLFSRRQRRAHKRRWRQPRTRALPSAAAMRRYLARFHNRGEEAKRRDGTAFIPAPSAALSGLRRVNEALVRFLQQHRRQAVATLDMDATLVETGKAEALYCYKHMKAYQPLNTWWAEHGVVLDSEFRDGNVPAGHQQLRVFKAALEALPAGVEKIYLRSDSAGYQQELLLYCGEADDRRFGVIEFAVSADVTGAFRVAVAETPEAAWRPLHRSVDGRRQETDQEWAEVCFVPNWAGHSKNRADYRFLAIREPLRQLPLGDADLLPFPTQEFGAKGRYKLFALVTNRELAGDQVIWWHRQRCGKSEQAHAVMKHDLAGGQLPSGLFGANAAWWAMMILAHNLNAVMKRLVLGAGWQAKRMKALRFHLIAEAGRVIRHARRLILRLAAGHPALALVCAAHRRIAALARGPTG